MEENLSNVYEDEHNEESEEVIPGKKKKKDKKLVFLSRSVL